MALSKRLQKIAKRREKQKERRLRLGLPESDSLGVPSGYEAPKLMVNLQQMPVSLATIKGVDRKEQADNIRMGAPAVEQRNLFGRDDRKVAPIRDKLQGRFERDNRGRGSPEMEDEAGPRRKAYESPMGGRVAPEMGILGGVALEDDGYDQIKFPRPLPIIVTKKRRSSGSREKHRRRRRRRRRSVQASPHPGFDSPGASSSPSPMEDLRIPRYRKERRRSRMRRQSGSGSGSGSGQRSKPSSGQKSRRSAPSGPERERRRRRRKWSPRISSSVTVTLSPVEVKRRRRKSIIIGIAVAVVVAGLIAAVVVILSLQAIGVAIRP